MLDVFDVCMEWDETLPDLPYLEVQHIASEADFLLFHCSWGKICASNSAIGYNTT